MQNLHLYDALTPWSLPQNELHLNVVTINLTIVVTIMQTMGLWQQQLVKQLHNAFWLALVKGGILAWLPGEATKTAKDQLY